MSNPATGLSKGYGFVSYSKPEEAALALNEMNGIMVRSKAMVVAYHEPKKPRQEKSSSTTTSSFHSPPSTAPPVEYGTVPYFETRHPHEGKHPFTHLTCHSADLIAILGPSIEPVDPLNLKELSLNPTVPMQRKVKKKKKINWPSFKPLFSYPLLTCPIVHLILPNDLHLLPSYLHISNEYPKKTTDVVRDRWNPS
jgi:RNA recognition motif-containing protein